MAISSREKKRKQSGTEEADERSCGGSSANGVREEREEIKPVTMGKVMEEEKRSESEKEIQMKQEKPTCNGESEARKKDIFWSKKYKYSTNINSSRAVVSEASNSSRATAGKKWKGLGEGEKDDISTASSNSTGRTEKFAGCQTLPGLALIVTDLSGCVVHWNIIATQTFGIPPEIAVGQEIFSLLPIVSGSEEERGMEVFEALINGRQWTSRMSVRTCERGVVDLIVTDTPVTNDDGTLVGVVEVMCDVTISQNDKISHLHRQLDILLKEHFSVGGNHAPAHTSIVVEVSKVFRAAQENVEEIEKWLVEQTHLINPRDALVAAIYTGLRFRPTELRNRSMARHLFRSYARHLSLPLNEAFQAFLSHGKMGSVAKKIKRE